MSVSYKANTDWIQRAPTLWTADSWGVDHARVLFRGRLTAKDAFENTLIKWSAMSGFPMMRLEGWNSIEMTPSFPGVELHYQGFKSGTVPLVKSVDGNSVQTAQGSGTDTVTGKQVTGSFLYKASRTTWTWFENSQPSVQPRYATVRDQSDPLSNIISYSITDEDTDKPLNSISLASLTAVFNSLVRKIIVSNYEREMIIPNLVWACRSEVDFKVI